MTHDEGIAAARVIAQRIVSGSVSPLDGATAIWKRVVDRLDPPVPDELWTFKSNASAIEDCVWNAKEGGGDHAELIARCEREIVEAARVLAATVG